MYGGYGRKGFKRKAGSYKAHSRFAKRRYPGRGSFQGLLPRGGKVKQISSPFSWRNSAAGNPNVPYHSISRGPTFFPERLSFPLKWTLRVNFSISTGVGYQLILGANSVFDPGQSLSATQPYGYDILTQIYRFYIVKASGVQVQFTLNADTGTQTQQVVFINWALWPSLDTTSYVSDEQAARQAPYSKNGSTTIPVSTTPWGVNIARNYISTAKVYGVPPARVQLDGYFHGALTANPTSQWYWNFLVEPQSQAGISNELVNTITMIQYCEFYGFNDIPST